MKRYGFVMFVIALLLLVLSGFVDNIPINGITFDIKGIILNVSATLFSIVALAFVYKYLGEEPTVKLITDLIEMQGVAKKLHQIGIQAFGSTRSEFNIPDLHNNFANGKNLFIVSRNFNAIKYARVKDLFKDILHDRGKHIKILIRDDSSRKDEFKQFKNSLPANMREKIEFRETTHVMSGMYGNERRIYVTVHMTKFSGDESPMFLCENTGKESLYQTFLQEFNHLWENAKPI